MELLAFTGPNEANACSQWYSPKMRSFDPFTQSIREDHSFPLKRLPRVCVPKIVRFSFRKFMVRLMVPEPPGRGAPTGVPVLQPEKSSTNGFRLTPNRFWNFVASCVNPAG